MHFAELLRVSALQPQLICWIISHREEQHHCYTAFPRPPVQPLSKHLKSLPGFVKHPGLSSSTHPEMVEHGFLLASYNGRVISSMSNFKYARASGDLGWAECQQRLSISQ